MKGSILINENDIVLTRQKLLELRYETFDHPPIITFLDILVMKNVLENRTMQKLLHDLKKL